MGWPSFFIGPSTSALGLSRRLRHPRPWWAFPSWRGLSCWACCARLGVPACSWPFLAVLGMFRRYRRWDGFRRLGVFHPRHSACRAVVVVVLWSSSWCCRLCCPFAVVVVLSRLSLCCCRRRCCVVALLPRRLGCDGWICWRWGRVGSVGWNRMEGRKRTVWASHFLGPPLSSSFLYPSVERKRAGPHPYGEGRGTGCMVEVHCW